MKKTILVALIAVSMLFAFTACEQQIPNMLPDDVNYIAIEQIGTAVEGKAFDPSLFNIVVYSSNPNVAPVTVPGAGYVTTKDTDKLFDSATTVEASYAGVQASPLAVEVATIESVTITGLPETAEKDAKVVDKNTLTAEATLSNGETLPLTVSDYDVTYSTSTVTDTTDPDDKGSAVTVSVWLDGESNVYSNSTTYYVVITPAVTSPATFEGIEVTYTVTRTGVAEPIAKDVTTLSGVNLYVNDVVYAKVTKVMSEDESNSTLAYGATIGTNFQVTANTGLSTYGWNAESNGDYQGTYKFTVDSARKTATINFYDAASGISDNTTIDISAGSPVVTVSNLSASQNNTTVSANTNITPANISTYVDFNGISKDDGNTTTATDTPVVGTDYTITFPYASSYVIPAEGNVTVWYVVSYQNYGVETHVPGSVALTVKP